MGIFKKLKHQITHKERSQPKRRQKLGFLEKKRDYLLRAKDAERYKKRLSSLHELARQPKEDEFYFSMKNSRLINQTHYIISKKDKEISLENQKKLIYLKNKLVSNQRKTERIVKENPEVEAYHKKLKKWDIPKEGKFLEYSKLRGNIQKIKFFIDKLEAAENLNLKETNNLNKSLRKK